MPEVISWQGSQFVECSCLDHPLCYLGGGFKHSFSSPLPGEVIQFDSYFPNGSKPPTSFVILLWWIEIPAAAKDVFGEVQWLRAIGFGSHDEAAVFLCESMGPCDPPLTTDVSIRCIKKTMRQNGSLAKSFSIWLEEGTKHQTRWWFQTFFIFTPIWGRFPFWLL